MISYDRATFVGTNTYYVSFNNIQVGKLIGQGFVDVCLGLGRGEARRSSSSTAARTPTRTPSRSPRATTRSSGAPPTTPLTPGSTNTKGYTLVGDQITPGWTNATGATIFQQQFTAHPKINATVEANDGLANAVITVLKNKGVGPKKIPTTGQDATLQGMENVLQGYQCGSVYKADLPRGPGRRRAGDDPAGRQDAAAALW